MTQPRILVVDDHEVVREGVKHLIVSSIKEFEAEVLGASSSGEAISLLHANELTLVITDITIEGRGGLDLIQEICRWSKPVPVLVFTNLSEEEFGVRAIRAGASGYVNKADGNERLLEAIAKILQGARYVSQRLADSLVVYVQKNGDRPKHHGLSDREFQVLLRLAHGGSIKEISGELFLSVKTVSTYRARIFEKLKVNSIADAIRYCIEHKLD